MAKEEMMERIWRGREKQVMEDARCNVVTHSEL